MELKPKKLRKSLKRLRQTLDRLDFLEQFAEEDSSAEPKITSALNDFTIELAVLLRSIPSTYLHESLALHRRDSRASALMPQAEVVSVTSNDHAMQSAIRQSEERLQSFFQETMKAELSKVSKSLKFSSKKGSSDETEDSVRQSERRLRTIIDSTPLGICITTEKGVFEYVNQAYCDIYGYSSQELLGNHFTMIVEPEKKEMWVDLHDKYMLMSGEEIKGYSDIRTEWKVIHKTGKPITILADAARIVGTDQRPRKVTFVMNISEFARLRETLRQSEIQLMQADKMSSLGQMVAGVAHEINTPLGFVKSNIQLLTEAQTEINELLQIQRALREEMFSGTSESVSTLLEDIEKKEAKAILASQSLRLCENSLEGITRIQELVQDLKNFSRLDEAELKSVPIKEIIDSSLKIAGHVFKEKGVTIQKQLAQTPTIKCYPAQLNQVFLNLLTNAAQAITHQNGVIKITSDVEGFGEKSILVVTVEDNGSGIPDEVMKKIFDPFFTTKEIGQGTGLGLSIVQKIINAHNGEISVKSQVGMGTLFRVALPLNQDAFQKVGETPKNGTENEKKVVSPFLDEEEVQPKKSTKAKFKK